MIEVPHHLNIDYFLLGLLIFFLTVLHALLWGTGDKYTSIHHEGSARCLKS